MEDIEIKEAGGERTGDPTMRVLRKDDQSQRRKSVSNPGVEAVIAGRTDRGARAQNEDHYLVATLERGMRVESSSVVDAAGSHFDGAPQGRLMALADGMGGHGGGELASSVALDAVAHAALLLMPWLPTLGEDDESVNEALRQSLREGQRRMRSAAARKGVDGRLGTTVTMAYVGWPLLHLVHIGDSRAYIYRGGELYQLTRDHTVAEELISREAMNREQATRSRFAHVLTKAVGGGEEDLDADFHRVELQPNDGLLLCSDGLSNELDDQQIAAHLSRVSSRSEVSRCVDDLIEAAKQAGGHDNITAVLAHF